MLHSLDRCEFDTVFKCNNTLLNLNPTVEIKNWEQNLSYMCCSKLQSHWSRTKKKKEEDLNTETREKCVNALHTTVYKQRCAHTCHML